LCEMLGYGERELLQLSLDDVIVTRMLIGGGSTVMDSALADGHPQEVVARRGDGTHLWIQITASRLQVDVGSGADQVHVIEDVSARKAAEDALAREHAELERRVEQLRHFATQLATAERRERVRLAGVLHDHLQQLLVAAKMHVEYTQNVAYPETPELGLERAKHLLEQCIDASRSLTLELSPPVLRHDGGLIPALQWLRDWMQSTHGLDVQLNTLAAAEPADVDLRALLFEAVRELLFNVVKHARVASATVTLARATDGTIVVSVHDQGAGFDAAAAAAAPSKSFGLFSLRERLDVFGAKLVIDAAPSRGTAIEIRVPDRRPATPGVSRQDAIERKRESLNSPVPSDR
jgi:PAS domain S-box-containing protein